MKKRESMTPVDMLEQCLIGRLAIESFLRLVPIDGVSRTEIYRVLRGSKVATDEEVTAISNAVGETRSEVALRLARVVSARVSKMKREARK